MNIHLWRRMLLRSAACFVLVVSAGSAIAQAGAGHQAPDKTPKRSVEKHAPSSKADSSPQIQDPDVRALAERQARRSRREGQAMHRERAAEEAKPPAPVPPDERVPAERASTQDAERARLEDAERPPVQDAERPPVQDPAFEGVRDPCRIRPDLPHCL